MTFCHDDAQVRASTRCPGCGDPKSPGCIVCWRCFKHRRDNPFKYFGADTEMAGNLPAWLRQIGRPTLEEQGIVTAKDKGGAV